MAVNSSGQEGKACQLEPWDKDGNSCYENMSQGSNFRILVPSLCYRLIHDGTRIIGLRIA